MEDRERTQWELPPLHLSQRSTAVNLMKEVLNDSKNMMLISCDVLLTHLSNIGSFVGCWGWEGRRRSIRKVDLPQSPPSVTNILNSAFVIRIWSLQTSEDILDSEATRLKFLTKSCWSFILRPSLLLSVRGKLSSSFQLRNVEMDRKTSLPSLKRFHVDLYRLHTVMEFIQCCREAAQEASSFKLQ